MPTNREYLDQLASESPDKLKAWFDAEHETDTSNKSSVNVTESREKLEADENEHVQKLDELDSREKLETDLRSLTVSWRDYDGNYMLKYSLVAYAQIKELLERQAAITANANKELTEWQAATVARLQKERDNLADDLLTCNREREQLRKHLGIALDHAHDICALVDIGE